MPLLHFTAVIKQPATSRDAYGAMATTWSTFTTARASMTSSQGAEDDAQGAQRGLLSHTVLIRYIAGVTNLMRVEIDSKTLEIIAVIEQGRRHMLQLRCREVI